MGLTFLPRLLRSIRTTRLPPRTNIARCRHSTCSPCPGIYHPLTPYTLNSSLALHAHIPPPEDMPVDPEAAWLAALRAELAANPQQQQQQQQGEGDGNGGSGGGRCHVPGLWAVDTACVVPMRLVARAHDKAYAYRSATEGAARVVRAVSAQSRNCKSC